jgi:hypothetical protein
VCFLCMRDVKEVHTTCVDSFLRPSCVEKGGLLDVRERSELFGQYQTSSALCVSCLKGEQPSVRTVTVCAWWRSPRSSSKVVCGVRQRLNSCNQVVTVSTPSTSS